MDPQFVKVYKIAQEEMLKMRGLSSAELLKNEETFYVNFLLRKMYEEFVHAKCVERPGTTDPVNDPIKEKYIGLLKNVTTRVDLVKLAKEYMDEVNQNKLQIDEFYENICKKTNFKDNELSTKFRDTGNELFQNKFYFEAVDNYNKAIAYAEFYSEALNKAFGNRSAVFYNMGLFEECIDDIKLAFKHGYPDKKLECFKLLKRQANCYASLNHSYSLNAIIKKIKSLPEVNKTEVKEVERETNRIKGVRPKQMIKVFHKMNPFIRYRNKKISYDASKAVELVHNNGKAQLVANRDVDVGEILIIDKNVISTLKPDNLYDHCTVCLRKELALFPCPNCFWVMYCSLRCMLEYDPFHCLECSSGSRLLLLAEEKLIPLLPYPNNIIPILMYLRVYTWMLNIDEADSDRTDEISVSKVFDGSENRNPVITDKDSFNLDMKLSNIAYHVIKCSAKFEQDNDEFYYKVSVAFGIITQFALISNIRLDCDSTIHLNKLDNNIFSQFTKPFSVSSSYYTSLLNPDESCFSSVACSLEGDCSVYRASRPINRGERLTLCPTVSPRIDGMFYTYIKEGCNCQFCKKRKNNPIKDVMTDFDDKKLFDMALNELSTAQHTLYYLWVKDRQNFEYMFHTSVKILSNFLRLLFNRNQYLSDEFRIAHLNLINIMKFYSNRNILFK